MTLLRHLALRCRDMERSRRFYELLGLRFVDYRPSREAMDLSDGTLNMTLIQHNGPQRTVLEEGTEFIHFGLLVDDARAALQRLKEAGAPLLRENVKERNEMDEMIPSGSFKVQDPDGNVIDISGNRGEWRGVAAV
jgi:catechol 2,3-dioxygenase-like lactoylglutathione lyase family enzyme